ncbi:hypothetical protein BDA96_01G407800 [Sorghum bicolor]|uniref:Uncharacterized protein n=2 Tax=Sorghum bicolor TaxID=4558 RepID=A0A921S444_SORBI|nr:hypothetical protein BDA96_01G407800 [Sorghum bicolor]OQU92658.1 hypothetical protein SORBI_3001G383350 [Sorghum bicolor]
MPLGFVSLGLGSLRPRAGDFGAAAAARVGTRKVSHTLLPGDSSPGFVSVPPIGIRLAAALLRLLPSSMEQSSSSFVFYGLRWCSWSWFWRIPYQICDFFTLALLLLRLALLQLTVNSEVKSAPIPHCFDSRVSACPIWF